MMRDFTLIILTCDRPQLLAAVLSCLEAQKADCRVILLDSSRPMVLATNRARVAASSLDIECAELLDLDPIEKWRQGIHKVTTPFCALCADGDVVILEGVRRCLDTLRGNLAASTVQGHSFTFQPLANGDMQLNNIEHFRPTIDDASPLQRLDGLFQQYQVLCHGVFRAPALQQILETLQRLSKPLARDLLWSALTVIDGHVIRLPHFSLGRCVHPSTADNSWHPLEWLCKDPDGLFEEYLRYRELAAAALLQHSESDLQLDEIYEILDLIHLRYLAQHAPDSVLAFITEQQIAGVNFAEYWPRHQVQARRCNAAGIRTSADSEAWGPVNIHTRERSYFLLPSFYAPRTMDSPPIEKIVALINVLDSYRPEPSEVVN
jgi:glycosyltransferase domain-containing protein